MTQCEVTNFDNQNQMDKMMNGGILYGTICFPKNMPKYIFLVVFPPMYFIIDQYEKGFPRIDKIIISFILTTFFYFPGLIYGLNDIECGEGQCISSSVLDNDIKNRSSRSPGFSGLGRRSRRGKISF